MKLSIFLFVAMCGLVKGDVKCSEVQTKPNVELEKILGVWYIVEGTPHPVMMNMRCIKFDITQENPESLYGIFELNLIETGEDVYTKVNMKWVPEKSLFIDEISSDSFQMTVEHKILDTDYDSYLLFFSCDKADRLRSWVLSKTREVSDSFLNDMEQIFQKNNLTEYQYVKFDQKNCNN